jgi:hypothetical protein
MSRSEYPERAWRCGCITLQKDLNLSRYRPIWMKEPGQDALALSLGGSILRSPSSSATNVSDPNVNWVSRGNFTLKLQDAMVFPGGS